MVSWNYKILFQFVQIVVLCVAGMGYLLEYSDEQIDQIGEFDCSWSGS